ncbi:hypothetical protein NP233_g5758 [Leucocoprinus birnbaumii]|uniref:Methyltransferase domain-containing protein n=1 Tax=Leucocoprinus birnbaumii TaxID=56174 RepID=A0AAD5VUY2_9AGAR|nr:hypothetical protein NP233_g5758 [Leucocoprinus birnbaumii]
MSAQPIIDTSTASESAWDASQYNKTASFVYSSAFVAPVIELLEPRAGERIMDLGCGSGEVTIEISKVVEKEAGGVAVGVDFSASMIEKARSNGLKHAFVSDIQDLEIPDHLQEAHEPFDAVFSNAALHWCKRDPEGVLRAARRILRPGGRFVAEMGGFMNCIGVRTAIHRVMKGRGYDPVARDPWYFPSMEDYVKLLVSSGFEPVHMSLTPRITPLASGLYDWLNLFVRHSFLGDIPDAEAKEILEEVADQCKVDCRDESGNRGQVEAPKGRNLASQHVMASYVASTLACPHFYYHDYIDLALLEVHTRLLDRKLLRQRTMAQRKDLNKINPTSAQVPPSAGQIVKSASLVGPALFDLYSMLGLVFGGCCTNVWAYEELLLLNPRIGSALTFSQMLFITLKSLPSFLSFPKGRSLPHLKSRQVPLEQWCLQVLVLTAGSLLNNWVYAYKVPLTIQIVFRSGSLAVSMLFGYLFLRKAYSHRQILSIAIVTIGVVLATLSRPSGSKNTWTVSPRTPEELQTYAMGILMLVISLFCTGLLGLLQEKTYRKYGPCWKEGVFYTHALSLPVFIFLGSDINQGLRSLSHASTNSAWVPYVIFAGNLVSQLICTSGVNRLSSQVSSVSTNIVLTARKAISLCFSVWWFGNDWNIELALGAGMVFCGSILYTTGTTKVKQQ